MDLRGYYQKLRELEAALQSEYVVVVSKETPDGGRAGTLTEVPRRLAAKLILDGAAELASPEQTRQWRRAQTATGNSEPGDATQSEPNVLDEPAGKRSDLVRKK